MVKDSNNLTEVEQSMINHIRLEAEVEMLRPGTVF